MKILFITTHINIGGVAKYILDVSSALSGKGINCFVASSGGELEKHFTENHVRHIKCNIRTKFEFNPKLIPAIFKLSEFVRDEKVDIIHAHTRVAQVIAFFVSRSTGIPFVSTCHGFFNQKRLSRRIFPCWGKRIIAIGASVREHLVNDLNVKPEKVEVIYNGVRVPFYPKSDDHEYQLCLKENLDLSKGPVIGAIGRLSSVKGLDDLLYAFSEVREVFNDANLILIGDGPEENALKELSRELAFEGSVFFMKSRIDAEKFLDIMDVYVFPSKQEGLGLSLLSAMAHKKACVASSAGGINDVIENNENGLLFAPGNRKEMADNINRLLKDNGLRFALGRKAHDRVLERFSLEKTVEKTLSFYEGVIK